MMEPYNEVLQAFSPPQYLHKNILNYFSSLFFFFAVINAE